METERNRIPLEEQINIKDKQLEAEKKLKYLFDSFNIIGPVTIAFGEYSLEDSPEENIPSYLTYNISPTISDKILTMVIKFFNEQNKNYTRLIDYDAGYKPDSGEVEWICYPDFEFLSNCINSIPKPTKIPFLDIRNKEFKKNFRFYVFIINIKGSNPIYCFYSKRRFKVLKPENILMSKIVGDKFTELKEPVFIFEDSMDFLAYDNYLYIFNKENFHYSFKFYDKLLETAKITLNSVNSRIPIDNFKQFYDKCCNHTIMVKKLNNIAKKPYLSSLTIEDICITIETKGLNINIVNRNGIKKIAYDPQNQWAILKLLDDDYLDSQMTKCSYESNSKRPLNNR